MKSLSQLILLSGLSGAPACAAWKLQEYQSSGCQAVLQTEGRTQWARCTNFNLPHDDNMARGVKYSGLTPAADGKQQWLFDLRLFKGRECSGEELFVSTAFANRCLPGPWKSFMVNQHVLVQDGNDLDVRVNTKVVAGTGQTPIMVHNDDLQSDYEDYSAPPSRTNDISVAQVVGIPAANAGRTCYARNSNNVLETKIWTEAQVINAIERGETCRSMQNNTCRNGDRPPYPHEYTNVTPAYYTFPIMFHGSVYVLGNPGTVRVKYRVEGNGNLRFLGLIKHPSPTNNDFAPC